MAGRCGTLKRFAALVAALALLAAPPALAAKKKGKTKAFAATTVVNTIVPEDAGAGASTALKSTIKVGKSYKGRVIGDLDVTGLQTTGDAAGAANDLTAMLTGPTGRTLYLFRAVGDQSLGPWTLDDDTSVGICSAPLITTCAASQQTLRIPFAGTSNLVFNDGPSFVPLQNFDGTRMKGTWTLSLVDTQAGVSNGTSVFDKWGLKITPAKPVKG
jgi:hypothetical protein